MYLDWLVLSARLLVYYVCCHLVARWKYYSKYIYIWSCSLMAMWGYYSLLLYVAYCYFRNIFPPWSSQMTILLITSAMYHIRYKSGEYKFKRNKPPRIDYRGTSTSPTDLILGKPPTIQGETLGYLHNPGSLSNMSEMSHYGMHASLQTSEALFSLRQSWLAGETCPSATGSTTYLKYPTRTAPRYSR